ncbi:hypothetical protein [Floccifex sp.]
MVVVKVLKKRIIRLSDDEIVLDANAESEEDKAKSSKEKQMI